jgi:ApaG protein
VLFYLLNRFRRPTDQGQSPERQNRMTENPMSDSDKYSIEVQAVAEFLPGQSSPEDDRYVFAYHITITNTGSHSAQLLGRHWIITDGSGKKQEVRGEGVVGEKPRLAPGEQYRYSSGSVLETPVGTMHGSYQLEADDGHRFEAPIPPFTLAMPQALH